MTNIKKKINNKWQTIATNNINNLICDNNQNINEILSTHTKEIEKLQHNVSWLALHGGGGAGSGSVNTKTEATITVNNISNNSGNSVVLDEGKALTIMFNMDASLTQYWSVTVQSGTKTILSGRVNRMSPSIVIEYNKLVDYFDNYRLNIDIIGVYNDEENAISGGCQWHGSIIQNVIDLSLEDKVFNYSDIDNSLLTFYYQTPIVGEYSLYLTVSKDSDKNFKIEKQISINIINENRAKLDLNLSTELFNEISISDNKIGVFKVNAKIQNNSNSNISKSLSNTFVVQANDIMISSQTMSADINNPINVSSISFIDVNFVAYYNGSATFFYNIKINNTPVFDNPKSGMFGTYISNQLNIKEEYELGKTLPVEICIYTGSLEVSKTYYINIVKIKSKFLKHKDVVSESELCSFYASNYTSGDNAFTIGNNKYNYNNHIVKTQFDFNTYNANSLSVITLDNNGTPYLRLSNNAYGKITHNKNNTAIGTFDKIFDDYCFSINIVFKADYHPDDERTVLFFGSSSSEGKPLNGISINVHDVYFNSLSVYKLTDNTINDITITHCLTKVNQNGNISVKYVVKLYIDGVLSYITLNDGPMSISNIQDIYFGCLPLREITVKPLNLCDCNIYAFSIYHYELSDFDIFINYINNKLRTNYKNNELDFENLLPSELAKNFCSYNEETGGINSLLFNSETNKYVTGQIISGNGLNYDNLSKYKDYFKIPIIFLDLSNNSEWTFDNFSKSYNNEEEKLPAAESVTFEYYDPTTNKFITLSHVKVELQGTSTLTDFIKNLELYIPDGAIFIPKETWLPESRYTLKADIVDSGHCNNPAVGKFINEILGDASDNKETWLPYANAARNNFYNSNYYQKHQPTATLKHTVEGFPVLLFIKFANPKNAFYDVQTIPVGIYSFNLGRGAKYNLGFETINRIIDNNGNEINITGFPFAATNCTIENNGNNTDALWIEADATQTIQGIDQLDTVFDSNLDTSHADFWQFDDDIINELYKIKYTGNSQISVVSQCSQFKNGVQTIARMPIEGNLACEFNMKSGSIKPEDISPNQRLYHITKESIKDENGNEITANTFVANDKNSSAGEYASTFSQTNDMEDSNIGFNIQSASKYFVTALLFGLKDNFGKNISFRCWGNEPIITDFYDLDCAFQDANQGTMDFTPDSWIKYLFNNIQTGQEYGFLKETFDKAKIYKKDPTDPNNKILNGTQSVVSANHNKLWLSLDSKFAIKKWSQDSKLKSFYTQYWHSLRMLIDNIIGNSKNSVKIHPGDWFVDTYFKPQMENCGPVLFNLDYKIKYLAQVEDNYNDYSNSKALSKLHGRKISIVRDWLKKHIDFLDSLFYLRDTSQSVNYYNNVLSACNSTVGTTPVYLPMKSNSPVILKHSLGSNTSSFYFMPENVYTNVAMANQYTSDRSLVWLFTCSNKIIELGNNIVPLNSIDIGALNVDNTVNIIDGNGFPSLTSIDLSNLTNITSLNVINLFASRDISELRDINLSGINGTPLSISFVDNNNNTKFIKLNSINISGSKNIQSVLLPSIPLSSVNFSNSMIQKLTLNNQRFIKTVDITGCSNLQEINLRYCDAYQDLNLNNYNELHTISILNCPSISSIIIDNCKSLKNINIEQCSNLKTIQINNCPNLTGINNVSNNVTFIINECNKLISVNLSNNINLTHLAIYNSTNITSINLTNTNIYNIKINNTDDIIGNHVDLTNLNNLTDFYLTNNTKITELYLPNIRKTPVNVNIQSCKLLKRVYGHIRINQNSMFVDCVNFSILGRDPEKYLGYSIKDGNYVRTPWEVLMLENSKTPNVNMISENMFNIDSVFISGKQVTNVQFANEVNILYYYCHNTNITLFDIYYCLFIYALQIKAGTITNMSIMTYGFCSNNNDNGIVTPFFDMSINRNISRWTFYGCKNITSTYASLRVINCPITQKYLPSPSYTLDSITGKIVKIVNDGLYSPLINIKHISIYSNIFDQYLFIGADSNGKLDPNYYHNLQSIYFTNNIICCSKNIIKYTDSSYTDKTIDISTSTFIDKLKDSTFIKQVYPNLANVTYLFASTSNLLTIYDLYLKYLNYNTIKIPKSVQQISSAFNATWGYGKLNFNNIYSLDTAHVNDSSKLTIINQSFNVTNENIYNDKEYSNYNVNNSYVKFILSNDTFSAIPNISYLGDGMHIEKYIQVNNVSFNGNGIKKELYNSELPKNIFKNLSYLKYITNLFTHVIAPNMASNEYIKIPGDLFKYNTELTSINNLFKDMYVNYRLTPNGFENCPNLTYCAYVFANTEQRSYLQSYIPYHLFYHGQNKITKTFYGTNDSTVPKMDDFASYVKKVSIDYYQPIASINTMEGCFMNNLNITHYQNNNIELDYNLNYIPFSYTVSEGEWTPHQNQIQYVHAWSFDGYTNRYDNSYIYKDNPVDNSNINYNNYDPVTIGTAKKYKTPYFMCAPDLFRYCSNNAIISSCFDGCGIYYHKYYNTPSLITFSDGNGINGRIPEYLFEPVKNTTSLAYMFRNCTNISPYKQLEYIDGVLIKNDNIYHIPKNLFNGMKNITDLTQMFRGFIFERYAEMNVFNNIPKNNQLNISGIFAGCIWGGKTTDSTAKVWNISKVFSSHNTININGALCNLSIDNSISLSREIKEFDYHSLTNYYNNISFVDMFNQSLNYNYTYNVYKSIKSSSTNVTVEEKNYYLNQDINM